MIINKSKYGDELYVLYNNDDLPCADDPARRAYSIQTAVLLASEAGRFESLDSVCPSWPL